MYKVKVKVLQKVQYNSDGHRSSLLQGFKLSSHCDVVELLERAWATFCIMVKKWFDFFPEMLISCTHQWISLCFCLYAISLLVQTPLELRMGIRFIYSRWESWGNFFLRGLYLKSEHVSLRKIWASEKAFSLKAG